MIPDYKNKSLELIVREIDEIVYTEEWKPVVECPTKYHISSFGRLKKLSYKSRNIKKPDLWYPEKIITGGLTKKGYVRFVLKYGGKDKSRYSHRLVGLAFIPLVDGKPDINHKKCIKTDNHYTQLEWCTPQENNEHGVIMGVLKRGRTIKPKVYIRKEDKKHKPPKKIINIETGEIFISAEQLSVLIGIKKKEINRQLNGERYCLIPFRYLGEEHKVRFKPIVPEKTKLVGKFDANGIHIQNIDLLKIVNNTFKQRIGVFLNGRSSNVDGYYYKMVAADGSFIEPPNFVSQKKPRSKGTAIPAKPLIKYSLDGKEIQRYPSVLSVAKEFGMDKKRVRRAIVDSPRNYFKGYIWKYA